MSRGSRIGCLLLAGVLYSFSGLVAQELVPTEQRTGEVVRIVGRSVVVRTDAGEIKMYADLPPDVSLYVEGEPATLSDLRVGMKLNAIRWENVPEPVSVSEVEIQQLEEVSYTPPPVARYRHPQEKLESAISFVAETVSEDSRRIERPTFRVGIPDRCTMRFDRLDSGTERVPVYTVNLSLLDPERLAWQGGAICMETTNLENRIGYHELPVGEDRVYHPGAPPLQDSFASLDRFCFSVSFPHRHRVMAALSYAVEACDARTGW